MSTGVEIRTRTQPDEEGKKIEIQLYDCMLKKEKRGNKIPVPISP